MPQESWGAQSPQESPSEEQSYISSSEAGSGDELEAPEASAPAIPAATSSSRLVEAVEQQPRPLRSAPPRSGAVPSARARSVRARSAHGKAQHGQAQHREAFAPAKRSDGEALDRQAASSWRSVRASSAATAKRSTAKRSTAKRCDGEADVQRSARSQAGRLNGEAGRLDGEAFDGEAGRVDEEACDQAQRRRRSAASRSAAAASASGVSTASRVVFPLRQQARGNATCLRRHGATSENASTSTSRTARRSRARRRSAPSRSPRATVNKERARKGEAQTASQSSRDDISSGRRGGLRSGHEPAEGPHEGAALQRGQAPWDQGPLAHDEAARSHGAADRIAQETWPADAEPRVAFTASLTSANEAEDARPRRVLGRRARRHRRLRDDRRSGCTSSTGTDNSR